MAAGVDGLACVAGAGFAGDAAAVAVVGSGADCTVACAVGAAMAVMAKGGTGVGVDGLAGAGGAGVGCIGSAALGGAGG